MKTETLLLFVGVFLIIGFGNYLIDKKIDALAERVNKLEKK